MVSVTKKGISGSDEIAAMMDGFRNTPPNEVAGQKVVTIRDYQLREERNLATGKITGIELPKSNVIQVVLEDGSLFTARPSGTEPKIKFYISVKGDKLSSFSNFKKENRELENKIEAIKKDLNL